jgi:integrase/recombinase XerD
MKQPKSLSSLVQQFFSEYLITQRQVSQHTVGSYRDCFAQLLQYAQEQYHRPAASIELEQLNARFVTSFLAHLENDRGICVRSRNQRLAAIHSFFHYIALYVPEHIELIRQVLAIPAKRYQRKVITYLTHEEIECLLQIPDRGSWIGRRDHAVLMLMIQTGLRVSEVTHLCCQDLFLETGAHIRCAGKGRKERCTPIMKQMVRVLKSWIIENDFKQADPLFPSVNGVSMSSDAVQYLVSKHAAVAAQKCRSLKSKRITPHVLRHTAAMELLQAGIDHAMIALWLGHESVETTQIYLEADLSLKQKLLESFAPVKVHRGRYIADDKLLDFLRAI